MFAVNRSSVLRPMHSAASCAATSICWCLVNSCSKNQRSVPSKKTPTGSVNMSSTESGESGDVLVSRLAAEVAKVGEQYRDGGRTFFPLGASTGDASYFVKREARQDVRAEMT